MANPIANCRLRRRRHHHRRVRSMCVQCNVNVSEYCVRLHIDCLFDTQGELIDSVEHHVEASTDYITKGQLELGDAHKYQSKARKVFFPL